MVVLDTVKQVVGKNTNIYIPESHHLSVCSLLCGFKGSLLHISKKLQNIAEFSELLAMKFTNRTYTSVKLQKCNTNLLC